MSRDYKYIVIYEIMHIYIYIYIYIIIIYIYIYGIIILCYENIKCKINVKTHWKCIIIICLVTHV
jgi:hypothetical protein